MHMSHVHTSAPTCHMQHGRKQSNCRLVLLKGICSLSHGASSNERSAISRELTIVGAHAHNRICR